jgi:hypothetical protein
MSRGIPITNYLMDGNPEGIVNGRTFWKDKQGKTLKQIEDEKIDSEAINF